MTYLYEEGLLNSFVLNALGTLMCAVNFWNDVYLVEIGDLYSVFWSSLLNIWLVGN